MAVKDETAFNTTSSLIYQQPRKRYTTTLQPQHWQLRSQLGQDNEGNLYHIGGPKYTQISKLNPTTRTYEPIRRLTFKPRCLVAQNGWVCCGGELGELVILPLRGQVDPRRASYEHIDADSRLQLDLGRLFSQEYSPSQTTGTESSGNTVVKPICVGKDRVNCITLWFPPSSKCDRHRYAYDKPVAVLANNDKHVTTYGLQEQEVVDDFVYPDYVNRALISPDGSLLAAICDDPYLYIRRRQRVRRHSRQGNPEKFRTSPNPTSPASPSSHTSPSNPASPANARGPDAESEWGPPIRIFLKSQKIGDDSDDKGSFAACFSSTGMYLAVGTQYGTISVFDTRLFFVPDADPLITSWRTKNSNTFEGSVRDMAFCPGPYDLLAWTEHSGNVGIADVRRGFKSWQILSIQDSSDFDLIDVLEHGTIDPRLLHRTDREMDREAERTRAEDEQNRQTMERLSSTLAEHRNLRIGSESAQTQNMTQEERSSWVFGTLERAREELRQAGVQSSPASTTVRPAAADDRGNDVQQTADRRGSSRSNTARANRASNHAENAPTGSSRSSHNARGSSSSLVESWSHAPATIERSRSSQNQIQARRYAENAERQRHMAATIRAVAPQMGHGNSSHRSNNSSHTPVRTSSTIPQVRNSSHTIQQLMRAGMTIPPGLTDRSSNPLAHTRAGANLRVGHGWDDLEALNNMSMEEPFDDPQSSFSYNASPQPSGREVHTVSGNPYFTSAQLIGLGSRAATESSPMRRRSGDEALGLHHAYLSNQLRNGRDNGCDTAGLVWSGDGKILYVAAENGIYEFHVNVHARRQFPSVTLR